MGKILKNSIEYATGFFGRLRGKFISETPSNDAYDWDTAAGPPAETQYYTGFEIQDAQQDRLSNMDVHAQANGSILTVIGARKRYNGSTIQNQVYIGVNGNGARFYGVDDAAAARDGIGIKDAVIEQGTAGIWTYRKWASGVSECWGTFSKTGSHYATTLGGYAYNSGAVSFPSGVFIAAPICHYSSQCGNGMALTGTITTNLTKDSNTYYTLAQVSGNQTCYWYIYAIGRWQ